MGFAGMAEIPKGLQLSEDNRMEESRVQLRQFPGVSTCQSRCVHEDSWKHIPFLPTKPRAVRLGILTLGMAVLFSRSYSITGDKVPTLHLSSLSPVPTSESRAWRVLF